MDLRELGEREAIKELRKAVVGTDDLGSGEDDCAVLPLDDGRLLLASTDVIVGPTHMLPEVPPQLLGAFAAEVAISDVAAMGGTPIGILSAYAMPPGTEVAWLQLVSLGMSRAAVRVGTSVLGGDTKASPEATIAVTALGLLDDGRCLYRKDAQPGDVLILTGPVGGPAMGFLAPAGEDGRRTQEALELIYGVKARVDEGRAMSLSGRVHACIDLSDGLAPALHQMMEASEGGAMLAWKNIPVVEGLAEVAEATGRELVETALNWGGEYELLAAVHPEGIEEVFAALAVAGCSAAPVGYVTEGREILLVRDGTPSALSPKGFDHFGSG